MKVICISSIWEPYLHLEILLQSRSLFLQSWSQYQRQKYLHIICIDLFFLMKSNFLKFPRLKNPPWSHLVESTLRLPHRSSYSTPSLGCKEHSGQQSSKGEMPCLSFSENIRLNIHETPVKGSPSSDHEVGNGQVDQVEVDRRSHRLVEDHLVVEKVGVSGFFSKMYFVPWLT